MDKVIKKFVSFDFEIFGKVQGVYFRKHTQEEAQKLGLVGWVMNTEKKEKTVIGRVQGPQDKCAKMEFWLQNTGSPKSKIEKMVKSNEKTIDILEYKRFDVKQSN